jgi:predicted nucleotide-binding protein/predicted Rossmann-fold nucleotide-binding protein
MKLLFQGGWKASRDTDEKLKLINDYCKVFAKYLVKSNHQLILTSCRRHDMELVREITELLNHDIDEIKKRVIFLLPERIKEIPDLGVVHKFDGTRWWQEERTFSIQKADALITIGGGKGTSDSIEKAYLMKKPVFYNKKIQTNSFSAWKMKPIDYRYLHNGDADFNDDLNITADEYYKKVFNILDKLDKEKYPRNIFIVHGRDHVLRDKLCIILEKMAFHVTILDRQPNKGLTVIEKLEREVDSIGFSFIIYTPDDYGRLKGESEKARARQNVIFEHGLLLGLLGRQRTCAIIQNELELPSDLNGIICERVADIEKEALTIARILKNANYSVDLRNII